MATIEVLTTNSKSNENGVFKPHKRFLHGSDFAQPFRHLAIRVDGSRVMAEIILLTISRFNDTVDWEIEKANRQTDDTSHQERSGNAPISST